ncbi:MAG TPA: hypothetical protein VFL62_06080 [Bradyrhizobium sp.]|uniref:hypothetical protein n=1 Tax=Bradyrhizobium sp. TaxID=376 RepID=UPI002D80B40A|nr:hypothetical protein [Bradyrhizobium sp.]HET7885778.1 hypothetical protein [Bradyrhizobium sp.]
MNSSIYSADRATHLRIVVVALVCSIALTAFSLSARVSSIIAAPAAVEASELRGPGFTGQEAIATQTSTRRI